MFITVVSVLQAEAVLQPATRIPLQPNHTKSPTHIEPRTTRPMWQFNRKCRKLLMMDILMSETCWARKMWNKITSDIKLVFYSSTITMMHGPIYIIFIMSSVIFGWRLTLGIWKFKISGTYFIFLIFFQYLILYRQALVVTTITFL